VYISRIFNSKEDFIETLMEDLNVKREEIYCVTEDGDVDDYMFVSSEDGSFDYSFFYMSGNSGRIIIVEESGVPITTWEKYINYLDRFVYNNGRQIYAGKSPMTYTKFCDGLKKQL
jgi:hypothetical protein